MMKQNLREILENKYRDTTDDGLDSLIASVIISELNSGIKPNINTIAEKSFTNKSSISRFAKKCGFEGYKQFIELLWIEENNYYKRDNDNYENGHNYDISYISSDLEKYNDDIIKFAELLNKSNNIFVFNSYQNEDIAELFSSNLKSIGKKVTFVKNTYNQQMSSFVNKDSLAIYLVAGTDNWTMQKIYNNIKTISKTSIVVGTKSQVTKFKDPNLEFQFQTPDTLFREVYKKMWFTNFIFKTLNQLSKLDINYKKNILNPKFKY